MTREALVAAALARGWKPWGKLRKYGGSSYQCFRRKADYIWIGLRFVEHTQEPLACDFVTDEGGAIKLLD